MCQKETEKKNIFSSHVCVILMCVTPASRHILSVSGRLLTPPPYEVRAQKEAVRDAAVW